MNSTLSNDTAKDQMRSSTRDKRSAKRAKRGEDVIYDVIDEWLAPALARWIASSRTIPNKENS